MLGPGNCNLSSIRVHVFPPPALQFMLRFCDFAVQPVIDQSFNCTQNWNVLGGDYSANRAFATNIITISIVISSVCTHIIYPKLHRPFTFLLTHAEHGK